MSHVVRWINSFAFWKRLALWSLSLHGVWEFFQCIFFYDMNGFNPLTGALWMLGATLADTVLTLLLVGGVLWFHRRISSVSFALALIFAGFLAAIGIESAASLGEWWRYAPAMPQLHFVGVTLGLLPLLQMALLPWVGAKFAQVKPFAR